MKELAPINEMIIFSQATNAVRLFSIYKLVP